MSETSDVARIRFINAMRLFDEFVQATVKSPDAATLRGLERRFAERLHIQPSYWSQIKGGSRQIGERLARQFELLCRKPLGWLDQSPSTQPAEQPERQQLDPSSEVLETTSETGHHHLPQDDDERFIMGLVLTYYRRHPQRARARLLDLLGEVLAPTGGPAMAGHASPDNGGVKRTTPAAPPRDAAGPQLAKKPDEEAALWARSLAGISPLKRKT